MKVQMSEIGEIMALFKGYLMGNEKSEATIGKYGRDLLKFFEYAEGKDISKDLVLGFKSHLIENEYAYTSINSMIAAINSFLLFMGMEDLRLKYIKVQKQIFRPEEREISRKEYERLCLAAERKNDKRLSLLIQTICSTGIRVSELKYITAETVKDGRAVVSLKGKTRIILIPNKLQQKLIRFMKSSGIVSGPVFISGKGKPLSRTYIWRAMKNLCAVAGIDERKVYPHNLRHLFARIFYSIEKDIVKLADMLGHSSIDTTRIYVMSTGIEHRRKLETMRLVI